MLFFFVNKLLRNSQDIFLITIILNKIDTMISIYFFYLPWKFQRVLINPDWRSLGQWSFQINIYIYNYNLL